MLVITTAAEPVSAMAKSVMRPTLTSPEFLQGTLDALGVNIAILVEDGTIVAVNSSWEEFAREHGLDTVECGPGSNYLDVCDSSTGELAIEAGALAQGIRDIFASRRSEFEIEYPCHSGEERRRFNVRVTRFDIDGQAYVVVAHDNITRRKLSEIQVQTTNRILESLASSDGLTEIPNRRSFDRTIEREWHSHLLAGSALTVALLDVDCFKRYNDRAGHLAGDDCLRDVARTIRATLRTAGDFVARYGGEEFAVILPHTTKKPAGEILRRIQEGIKSLAIAHWTSTVRLGIVTISIGAATAIPGTDGNETLARLIDRADKALYKAKSLGRDRLEQADD